MWNLEKFNKYMSRIDGAIMQGRYSLALKLVNRFLKLYYSSFINYKIPYASKSDNLRFMSIQISRYLLRYFRKYKIPYSERRIFVMNLISSVVVLYMVNMNEAGEEVNVIDKATATYLRENMNQIFYFLNKYV